MGKFATIMIRSICEMKVPDHINGTASASELAEKVGADSNALYRVLRALSVMGVFEETPDNMFKLTDMGVLLRSDTPGSLRSMAIWIGQPFHTTAWDHLNHSLTTGQPAFQAAFGVPVFDYLEHHPESEKIFQAAMTSFSGVFAPMLASGYDYKPFKTICDVGGGHGTLLGHILKAAPGAKGILFDLPTVTAAAPSTLTSLGVVDRVEVVGGDMFHSVPSGVDCYIMKHIVHDWGHAECVKFLTHCSKGLNKGGRVLVFEHVVPPPGVPDPSKLLDIEMLVMTNGGRERTVPEFEKLFSDSGLKFTRVIDVPGPLKIVEAVVQE